MKKDSRYERIQMIYLDIHWWKKICFFYLNNDKRISDEHDLTRGEDERRTEFRMAMLPLRIQSIRPRIQRIGTLINQQCINFFYLWEVKTDAKEGKPF